LWAGTEILRKVSKMKNFSKLFGIIALAALIALCMVSCEKGGTIEVTNGQDVPTAVMVYKLGESAPSADTIVKDGKPIAAGKKATWTLAEDGTYIVTAIPPAIPFLKTVTLLAGNTEKVTVR
jgi:hypothetical protein